MAAAARGAWQYRDLATEDWLPPRGRRVELSGRGEIFVRSLPGPRNARPVVLLHGWIASGGLNWFRAFEPLQRHFSVVAPDMRGHGRGIRSLQRFSLNDCADDVAALLDAMKLGPALVVGYSMGGPVAQLLWRRHPEKVAGLVMMATSAYPIRNHRSSTVFGRMMGGAALAARISEISTWFPRTLANAVARSRPGHTRQTRPESLSRWAGSEMRRHSVRHLFEAGAEIGRYDARSWIGTIDVPTAVIITERDRAMPAEFQQAMADQIPTATVHRVDHGHLSCVSEEFGRIIVDACQDVERRLA